MQHQVMWNPGMSIDEMTKQIIHKAMKFYSNDKVTVSNALRITPHALTKLLERYENERLAAQKRQDELRARQEEFKVKSRGVACNQPNGYIEMP